MLLLFPCSIPVVRSRCVSRRPSPADRSWSSRSWRSLLDRPVPRARLGLSLLPQGSCPTLADGLRREPTMGAVSRARWTGYLFGGFCGPLILCSSAPAIPPVPREGAGFWRWMSASDLNVTGLAGGFVYCAMILLLLLPSASLWSLARHSCLPMVARSGRVALAPALAPWSLQPIGHASAAAWPDR